MTYEEVKKEFEYYKNGTAGGFQTMLFDLFAKADCFNAKKLSEGFPHHYKIINEHVDSMSLEDLYK